MAQEKTILPEHVAIIMDGNGRWGQAFYGKRVKGHIKGVDRAREVIRRSGELGVKSLRLWGYSTENHKREGNEVNALMWLFRRFIVREADELDQKKVRVTFVGRRQQLPNHLQQVMNALESRTASNSGMRLEVALNYGGLPSVVDAVNALMEHDQEVTEESLVNHLYPEIPPPDFIIRTSGEMRTSGFHPLAVYAEWVFVETLWPDFGPDEYESVLRSFASRERRFGGLNASV